MSSSAQTWVSGHMGRILTYHSLVLCPFECVCAF